MVTSVVAAATYCDLCVPCKLHILADNSESSIAITTTYTYTVYALMVNDFDARL